MKNKGNTLGIVVVVLAVIAVLWFFTSGKALVVSKPNPNTITASAINAYPAYPGNNLAANSAIYSNTATQVYPYPSGKLAYVSYPIASSSSSSNTSAYYPSYPGNNNQQTYYPQNSGGLPAQSGCYVGGCSNQLCTDQPGAVSTCEYQPQYACFQRARCERQANRACGWTLTPEFYSCINNTY